MTIATNTLFRDGMPPAPPNHAAERKRLTELGQRAEECLIRALAEAHLNDAVRKEVGRVWGEYKEAMQRALHNMVEAAVDEMLTTKESFGKLQTAITRIVREEVDSARPVGLRCDEMANEILDLQISDQDIRAEVCKLREHITETYEGLITKLQEMQGAAAAYVNTPPTEYAAKEKRVERRKKGK